MKTEELIRKIVDPGTPEEALVAIDRILSGGEYKPEATAGFLDTKEACRYLGGISRTTLWKLRQKGLFSYHIGDRLLFDPDELRKFVLNSKKEE